jgi:hypothetical protein
MYNERMADCLNGIESSCTDLGYSGLGPFPTYRERAYDFGGVGQQIAYATAQLRHLHDGADHCAVSHTVSVDGNSLTTDNAASCVLYLYTPHAVSYDTNSAYYTRWQEWWSSTPNGGEYSSTNIISEDNFSNTASMTANQINDFLVTQGSWLANFNIPEYISVAYPIVYVAPPPPPPPRKTGDSNSDGVIDIADLSILSDNWGKNVTANTSADFNGDGLVDIVDLSILSDNWGK